MKDIIKNLKIALVHEELTQLGGAERVLDALLEIFPKAPVYTLVWDKVKTQHKYDKFDVRPSFIQKLPLGTKKYKWYLPLMPWAIESFNLKDFDLVISDASALIKGVKTDFDQIHICYCHTPTRYLWGETGEYLKTAPIPKFVRPLMPLVIWFLRRWDLKASKRPDFYIANARNIQKKIKKYYNRNSVLIYPPVETDNFKIGKSVSDYFLVAGRIEPYKKVDLVVKAFASLDKKLIVAGSGSQLNGLKLTSSQNVKFLGRVSDQELIKLYQNCLAYIFPQDEDFGIMPVEAMACGRPVIAYKKGGSLETVKEGQTGEFFYPQDTASLVKTLKKFDANKYNSQKIRKHALLFDKRIFKEHLLEYIKSRLNSKWN